MTPEEKARVVADVEGMWSRIAALHEKEPNPDVRALELAPVEEQALLRAMKPRGEGEGAAVTGTALGVLFRGTIRTEPDVGVSPRVGGPRGRPAEPRSRGAGDARGCRSWRTRSSERVGTGTPPSGYVRERRPASLEEDDRTGWVTNEYDAPHRADPAARVTGGPKRRWTDADREALSSQELRKVWQADGVGPYTDSAEGGRPRRHESSCRTCRLYHAGTSTPRGTSRAAWWSGGERRPSPWALAFQEKRRVAGSSPRALRDARRPGRRPRTATACLGEDTGPPAAHGAELAPSEQPERVAAAAAKVVGRPAGTTDADRAKITADVEGLWTRIVKVAREEPNPDVKAMTLAPSDRKRWTAMTPARAQGAARGGPCGDRVPGARTEGACPAFRLVWVALDADGKRARVVRTTGGTEMSFPVALEEGAWWPALGYMEVGGDSADDDDRSGFVTAHYPGPRMDPAARVTGGPAQEMSDIERHDLVRTLDRVWARNYPNIYWQELQAHKDEGAKLRLFHIDLEEKDAGRLVVANDAITLAVSVRRDGEWRLVKEANDAQLRRRPPKPEDQDGLLGE